MISPAEDESFEGTLARLCSRRGPTSSVYRRLLSRRGRLVLAILVRIARPIAERIAARELDAELRTKVDPDDVAQETMLSLVRSFPTLQAKTRGEFLRFVITLARNRIEDLRRRFRRSQKRNLRRERSIEVSVEGEFAELVAPEASPLSAAIDEEVFDRVDRALDRLSPERRKLLQLRYLDGRSWIELGQEAGVSPNALRMRVERYLMKLRSEIGRHDSSSV